MLDLLLNHGSLALIAAALLVAGLGVPLPEDPLLLAAGVVSHLQGIWLPGVIVGAASTILAADLTLFSLARRLGPSVLDRPLLGRLLSTERRARLEELFARRGDVVVFTARHLPGLRTPVFVLAGLHGMRPSRFVLWDGLGLLITAPLMVSAGWLGSAHVDLVARELSRAEHWLGAVLLLGGLITWWLLALRRRRRITKELDPPPDRSASEPAEPSSDER